VPKLITPRSWGKAKPPIGTTPNLASPLLRGAAYALAANEAAGTKVYNLVNPSRSGTIAGGAVRTLTPVGYEVKCPSGTHSYINLGSAAPVLGGVTRATLAFRFRINGTANESAFLSNWASQFLFRYNGGLQFYINGGQAYNPTMTFTNGAINTLVVGYMGHASFPYYWWNGKIAYAGEVGTTAINATSDADTWIGSSPHNNSVSDMSFLGAIFSPGVLWGAGECALWEYDPQSIFSPPIAQVWFGSTGAAPTFKPAWAVNSNVMIG
jgi:hypothetical protein